MRRPSQLAAAAVSCILLALVGGALFGRDFAQLQWTNPPLHSAMESVGGLAAIAIALVLLQRRAEVERSRYRRIFSSSQKRP